MIVGLVGFIGAGKGTVGDLLRLQGFKQMSFAGILKDTASVMFGWDRELLEGDTPESREFREQKDNFWSDKFGYDFSPRLALQLLGTEAGRNVFHKDIWVASLANKLRKSTDDIVISDCRFPNEIDSLRAVGAKIIWVERGERPVWYDWAVKYNTCQDDQYKTTMRIISELEESPFKYRIHESEWAWVGLDIDHHIENDSSIEDLYSKVSCLLTENSDAKTIET